MHTISLPALTDVSIYFSLEVLQFRFIFTWGPTRYSFDLFLLEVLLVQFYLKSYSYSFTWSPTRTRVVHCYSFDLFLLEVLQFQFIFIWSPTVSIYFYLKSYSCDLFYLKSYSFVEVLTVMIFLQK